MRLISALRDPYFIHLHRQRIHVLRSIVSLGFIFLIIGVLGIPHGSWALISALMVMGTLPHVGGVVIKGAQRLVGTILGALYGLVLLSLPIHSLIISDLITLAGIAWALYATFRTRYGYSALVFGITILMVVGDGNPELSTGLWRSINVIFGTTTAIVVTLVILPQKSTDVFRFLLSDNLDKINRLYNANITADHLDDVLKLNLTKTISAQYIKQLGLVEAVNQEKRISRTELMQVIGIERQMISTTELLLDTHWDTREGNRLIGGLEGLNEEQHRLSKEIGTLAYQLRTGQTIALEIARFSLQQYAEKAMNAHAKDGRWLFSPSGYLWLNHELALQTQKMIAILGDIQRLPSRRLRQKAEHESLISDILRIEHKKPEDPD